MKHVLEKFQKRFKNCYFFLENSLLNIRINLYVLLFASFQLISKNFCNGNAYKRIYG